MLLSRRTRVWLPAHTSGSSTGSNSFSGLRGHWARTYCNTDIRQSIDTSQSIKTPASSISHELWVTAASPSPPLLMSSLDRLCGHSVSGSSCCLFPPHLRGTGKRSLFPAFSQPDPPRPRQGSSSCTLCLASQFLFSHSSSNRATEQASPQNLCSGQRRAAHGEAPGGREE